METNNARLLTNEDILNAGCWSQVVLPKKLNLGEKELVPHTEMQNDSIQNTKTTTMVQTTNSQQQNSAAQITDESSQNPLQNQSVADVDTEISSEACNCKAGCSIRRCGCVRAGIPCGERCKCKHYSCDNQAQTANSQQQSNAAEITGESSQSHLQDQSVADLDTKKSSRPCTCEEGCSSRRCGCVRAGIQCGERCKCKHYSCANQIETANSQQQSDAAQITDESSQSHLQDQSVADLDTKKSSRPCTCEEGCSSRRCGCVRAEIQCGERCKCKHYSCANQVATANSQQQSNAAEITGESSQNHLQDQSVADLDTKKSSRPCTCEEGCSSRRCGCVRAEIQCGERCKCKHYSCANQAQTANSQQQSNAAEITGESSQSHLQDQSVADLDTKKSSRPCTCEEGCSSRRCGCVRAEIQCGERCKCKHYSCANQVATANSQQQSNAAEITGESSQSHLQDQSVADLDTKKSSRPCTCEEGCSSRRCGCVRAEIQCGERCKCKHYSCANQVATANSQQQSNAAEITGESSQSHLQDQSVADLDTKKSSRPCTCEEGCSSRRCGCVRAEIQCGERCKCKHYSCANQVATANSQQQSNAAEITGESSQSHLQDQSVADLDTKKSSRPCTCEEGCSSRRCGCVRAEIQCGERCKCKHYSCANQVATANSLQQSNAAEITGESSQSHL